MPALRAAGRNILVFLTTPPRYATKRANLFRFIAIAVLAGFAIACSLLPGAGFDWHMGIAIFAKTPTVNRYPAYIYLLISPLAQLPPAVSFAAFNGLSFILLAACFLLTDFPFPLIVFTLPVFWMFLYGQIDAWPAFGAGLGLWAMRKNKPYWTGAAVVMLAAKPHIGVALALFYLWKARSLKTLAVPALVALVSFIVFGFWPIQYLQTTLSGAASYIDQRVNLSLFPWSLAALPLIALQWRKMPARGQAIAVQSAVFLMLPYAPVYSSLPLLMMVNIPLLPLLMLPGWAGFGASVIFGQVFVLASLVHALFWIKAEPQAEAIDQQPIPAAPPV